MRAKVQKGDISPALSRASAAVGSSISAESHLLPNLQELGRASLYCGDYEDADARLQQALTTCGDRGDGFGEALTLGLLSRLACYREDYTTAREYALQGAHLAHELGNPHSEAASLVGLDEPFFVCRVCHRVFQTLCDTQSGWQPVKH